MINKLVIENLKHRWVRTFLSALVIGVQVTTILTLVGLSRGMLQNSADRAKGIGADILLRPPGSTNFTLASGQIKDRFVDFVSKQPNVKIAVGVLVQPVFALTTLNGVDIPKFEQMTGGLRYLEGGGPKNPDDLVVDDYYAREHKLHAGSLITVSNRKWRVAGVFENGKMSRLIAPLKRLQELTGNSDRVSQILVKLDDPSKTKETVAQLGKVLAGQMQAQSVEEFTSLYSIESLPPLRAFITVIEVLSVVVGFLVVFLSMYTAVIERTREIGILKALGAKPFTILDVLFRETIFLAVLGCVVGIALSFGTRYLIMQLVPASLQVVIVPDWWPASAAIAIVGALLGAAYPGLRAARQDAIEALSHE